MPSSRHAVPFTTHHKKTTAALLAASFLVPVALYLIAAALTKLMPFGDKSLLISDLSSQYVEFFTYYRDRLWNGGIFYSWQKSLGGNFFGIFAYYLASPFNVILFFFKNILWGIWALTVLKMGLSGLSFCVYLLLRGRSRPSNVLFAAMYALMAYGLVYQFNLLWLDGLIFLPLIVAGMERILEGKGHLLFLLSLTAMFISSYYISYMIALFCVFYFVYYAVVHFDKKKRPQLWPRFLRLAGSAVLAALFACVTLLPSFFALMQGKSDAMTQPPIQSSFYTFAVMSGVPKLLYGYYDGINEFSAPAVYCGTLALWLVLAFFFTRTIPKKEKWAAAGLLGILFAGMYFVKFNTFWHMLAPPISFPYRFAFTASFFLLLLAVRAWDARGDIAPVFWPVGVGLLFTLLLGGSYFHEKYGVQSYEDALRLLAVFFGLLAALRYFHGRRRWQQGLVTVVFLFTCGDLAGNAWWLLTYQDVYQEGYKSVQSFEASRRCIGALVQQAQDSTEGFYRLEVLDRRSPNEAFALGYHGGTHFSSLYERGAGDALENLGTRPSFYGSLYSPASEIRDAFLGVRYLVASPRKAPYYGAPAGGSCIYTLYRNTYALSLLFTGDSTALTTPFYGSGDGYTHRLLSALSGLPAGYDLYSDRVNSTYTRAILQKLTAQSARFTFPAQNRIEGQATAEENQYLFSTIPYDPAWDIRVDGQKVTPMKYVGGLLAIPFPAGTHAFAMHYLPKGLVAGAAVSGLSALLYLAGRLRWRRRREQIKKASAAGTTAKAKTDVKPKAAPL